VHVLQLVFLSGCCSLALPMNFMSSYMLYSHLICHLIILQTLLHLTWTPRNYLNYRYYWPTLKYSSRRTVQIIIEILKCCVLAFLLSCIAEARMIKIQTGRKLRAILSCHAQRTSLPELVPHHIRVARATLVTRPRISRAAFTGV